MTVSRWEKERSQFLLGRTRPGSSGRRRAETIGRRAKRIGRTGAGLSEAAAREDVTPSLFRRMLKTDQGAKEQGARIFLVPILFLTVGLFIGPAIAVAAAVYGALWHRSPQIGRLWAWPWLTASGVLLTAWAIVFAMPGSNVWAEGMTLHVYLPWGVSMWLGSQIALGLMFTGVQIRWCGWAVVHAGAAPKPTQDSDGNFLETPEDQKVALDALAGIEKVDEAPAPAKTTSRLPAMVIRQPPEPVPAMYDLDEDGLDDDFDITFKDNDNSNEGATS